MAPRILFLTPIVLSWTATVLGISQCWYPDGNLEQGHVPCNQTSNSASACCDPNDSCSGSGICLGSSGFQYRGSCTDQSWNSQTCGAIQWPQCITDPSSNQRYNRATEILSCSNPGMPTSQFCCSYGNGSSCCSRQFFLGNTGRAYQPGADAMVIDLSMGAGSNTTNITNVPSNNGGNIGTKIGLGIGLPISVGVLGFLGLLFYREHNKNKLNHAAVSTKASHMGPASPIDVQSPVDQSRLYSSYANPNGSSPPYPPTASHIPYSPQSHKPEPVYEAPVSNVHEMRG